MTTSDQEDQAEKRRVMLQDADVRRRQQEQSGTFLAAGLPQSTPPKLLANLLRSPHRIRPHRRPIRLNYRPSQVSGFQ